MMHEEKKQKKKKGDGVVGERGGAGREAGRSAKAFKVFIWKNLVEYEQDFRARLSKTASYDSCWLVSVPLNITKPLFNCKCLIPNV